MTFLLRLGLALLLLLLCVIGARANVAVVQTSTASTASVAATSVTTFGSNNTPGTLVCDYILTRPYAPLGAGTVTDQNGSVYVRIFSVQGATYENIEAWCTLSSLGPAAHLSLTAHFASSIVAESVAVEYSGAAATVNALVGNTNVNRAPACGGAQNWRAFAITPDSCAGGPTPMTSGAVTASSGSVTVILGSVEQGTLTVNSPWTSILVDSSTGFGVGEQLGAGTFNADMTPTTDVYHWAAAILELRKL